MATLEQIKELRDQTQVSVALCKEALEATGCDMDKAKLYLRQKGSDVAGGKGRGRLLILKWKKQTVINCVRL